MKTKSADEYEQKIRILIKQGQFFYAYDQSIKALEYHPDNVLLILLGAHALISSGAHNQAQKMLEPIHEQLEASNIKASKLFHLFQQCVDKSNTDKISTDINSSNVALFSEFAKTIQSFSIEKSKINDIKILKVAAEVYYKIWEETQQSKYLALTRNISLECFHQGGSIIDGIHAAVLSLIAQDKKSSLSLAEAVKQRCIKEYNSFSEENLCLYFLTLSLSYLLLNQLQQAIQSYQQAIQKLHGNYLQVVKFKKIVSLLSLHHLTQSEQLLEIINPPVIVIFAGQAIDHAEASEVFFPVEIEHDVAHSIVSKLDQINAEIGYCSAACGSDILFIEAMLDRGAEVNIILPFAEDDFLNARIRYAGKKWERRFKNALKLAHSVTWSTNDPYLNDDELFRYNNLLIEGGARLRAESLLTKPELMAVMDYLAPDSPGSAADFMDQWEDIMSLHMIDLDNIREISLENSRTKKIESATESSDNPAAVLSIQNSLTDIEMPTQQIITEAKPRKIKAMLFADIVHYSQLKEEQLPAIFEFLAAIKIKIEQQTEFIDLVESWGDALYVAMNSAKNMADYAVALCQAIAAEDHLQYGLTVKPELRIGLHAGPVYEGVHPLTGRKIVYGQHVSRAARIEPITVAGEIYTSEHFVAVLKAEENVLSHVAESTDTEFKTNFCPSYIGILELPKKFGKQAVYHLRYLG